MLATPAGAVLINPLEINMDEKTVTNRRSLLKGFAALTVTAGAAPVVAAAVTIHDRTAELIAAHKAAAAQHEASMAEVLRLDKVFRDARERELLVAMPGIGACQPWLVGRAEVSASYARNRHRLEAKGLDVDALHAQALANIDASYIAEEAIAERVGLKAAERANDGTLQRADDALVALMRSRPATPTTARAKVNYLCTLPRAEWEGRHVTALINGALEA